MKKIIIATYPRSGHHFLVERLLEPTVEDAFHYCEVYNHCRQVPCIDPKTNLQKTHDFLLNDPVELAGYKYIVQYRYPYESLVSYFLLESKNNAIEDSLESWQHFLLEKTEYWKAFMTKWAFLTNQYPDVFLNVQYYDLVHNTHSVVRKILEFLEVSQINQENFMRLEPNLLTNTTKFKYYNVSDVKFVESSCADFIHKLHIKKTTMPPDKLYDRILNFIRQIISR